MDEHKEMISDLRHPLEATPVSGMSPPPVQPDVLCHCPSCVHRSLHALRLSGDGTVLLKLPSAIVVPPNYCTISLSPTMESDDSLEYLAYRVSALVEVALSQHIMAPAPSACQGILLSACFTVNF